MVALRRDRDRLCLWMFLVVHFCSGLDSPEGTLCRLHSAQQRLIYMGTTKTGTSTLLPMMAQLAKELGLYQNKCSKRGSWRCSTRESNLGRALSLP